MKKQKFNGKGAEECKAVDWTSLTESMENIDSPKKKSKAKKKEEDYSWDVDDVDETWSIEFDDAGRRIEGNSASGERDDLGNSIVFETLDQIAREGILKADGEFVTGEIDTKAVNSKAKAKKRPELDENAIRKSVDEKIIIKSEELKGKKKAKGQKKTMVRVRKDGDAVSSKPEKSAISYRDKKGLDKYRKLGALPSKQNGASQFRKDAANWRYESTAKADTTDAAINETVENETLIDKIKHFTPVQYICVAMAVVILVTGVMTTGVYADYRGNVNKAEAFANLPAFQESQMVAYEEGFAEEEIEMEEAAAEPEEIESRALSLVLTSVEKDLKIKLVDDEDTLVKDIPWSVAITDSKNDETQYEDEDEDGIIHLTGISAGDYSVAIVPSDSLEGFTFPTIGQQVCVKAKVEYKVIANIKDEIKKESEVNAALEDNGNKAADVETGTALEDTVTWVESKEEVSGDEEYEEASVDLSKTERLVAFVDRLKTAVVDFARNVSRNFDQKYVLASLGKGVIRVADNEDGSGETGSSDSSSSSSQASAENVSSEDSSSSSTSSGSDSSSSSTEASTSSSSDASSSSTEASASSSSDASSSSTEASTSSSSDSSSSSTEASASSSSTADSSSTESFGSSSSTSSSSTSESSSAEVSASSSSTSSSSSSSSTTVENTVNALQNQNETISEAVESVSINKTSITIAKGEASVLTLSYTPSKAKPESIRWASVDDSVATVVDGTVTGVKAGTTKVGAIINTTLAVYCEVTVTDKGGAMVLSGPTELNVGDSVSVDATFENTSDKVKEWKASNTELVALTTEGNKCFVKGLKAGEVVITAVSTEGLRSTHSISIVEDEIEYSDNAQLYDSSKNKLYVNDNGTYRLAKYGDYKSGNFTKYYRKIADVVYTGWQTIDGVTYYYTENHEKVTGDQVIGGVTYHFGTDGALSKGSGILGIDVSKYQPSINWSSVKASGVSYVIIRCGYRGASTGSLIQDPYFTSHIKGAKDAGLKVGVYFFSTALNEAEAVEEASMCAALCSGYGINYPVFIDVEPSSRSGYNGLSAEQRTANIKAFCQTISSAGYTPGLYANKTWLQSYINTSSLSCKIWLAQYNAAGPTYTGHYDIWQYTSKGRIDGISGNVDMNQSYLGY